MTIFRLRFFWLLVAILLAFPAISDACPEIDGLVDINCDGRLVITGFGDSITYGRGDSMGLGGYIGRLRTLFPTATVVNLGRPGETSSDGRSRAAGAFARVPETDYAIVLEGTNDYWNKKRSATQTRANLLTMVHVVQNLGATSLLSSLTDTKRSKQSSWVKAVNSQISRDKQLDFYAFGTGIISGDGIHPNASGYQAMATYAANVLKQISALNRPLDSDGDKLYDYEELRMGTNPYNPDSDGDQILDGDEVFVYGSNPLSLDSDFDGFSDYTEVFIMNSDPADPNPGAPTLQSLEPVVE